jgi:co-chaperonin GroES (HSP10)
MDECDNGKERVHGSSPRVLFGKYAGTKIKLDGEEDIPRRHQT